MAGHTVDATIARLDDATARIVAALAALRRARPRVALLNQTTALPDNEVEAAVRDLQVQVSRDFAVPWAIDAALSFVPRGGTPPPDAWWLVLLDTADQIGALGYHETTAQGQPMGKVFVKTAQTDGAAWSSVCSHELLELLADPYAACTTYIQATNTTGTLYVWEVADACQGATYTINSTVVSDFVTPAWFTPGAPGPYDHLGHITRPAGPGHRRLCVELHGPQHGGVDPDVQERDDAALDRRGRPALPAARSVAAQHYASKGGLMEKKADVCPQCGGPCAHNDTLIRFKARTLYDELHAVLEDKHAVEEAEAMAASSQRDLIKTLVDMFDIKPAGSPVVHLAVDDTNGGKIYRLQVFGSGVRVDVVSDSMVLKEE